MDIMLIYHFLVFYNLIWIFFVFYRAIALRKVDFFIISSYSIGFLNSTRAVSKVKYRMAVRREGY